MQQDSGQNTEGRYSQDQDWRVLEPEETQVSETELAEIRRLKDSTSRAEGLDPFAPVFTPVLSPPKPIKPLSVQHAAPPSIPELDELIPFQEQFPDEFQQKTLESLVSRHWKQFDASVYTPDEMIMMIIALEMQRMIDLHRLTSDHPCTYALKSLQIRILVSQFPTMKLLLDSLMISARSLKLPEDLAWERTQITALDYLIENLEGQRMIPPSFKTEKALSPLSFCLLTAHYVLSAKQ